MPFNIAIGGKDHPSKSRSQFLSPLPASAARADLALLKAVARARQWSEDLLTGRAQSVAEVAEREGVGGVTCDDCRGWPELTAEAVAERIELPLLWTEQELAVGIS